MSDFRIVFASPKNSLIMLFWALVGLAIITNAADAFWRLHQVWTAPAGPAAEIRSLEVTTPVVVAGGHMAYRVEGVRYRGDCRADYIISLEGDSTGIQIASGPSTVTEPGYLARVRSFEVPVWTPPGRYMAVQTLVFLCSDDDRSIRAQVVRSPETEAAMVEVVAP